MKNKSLSRKWLAIGISITAVILLTLSSLTNVVGYQSVKSTVNDSPLFVTKTQRAINQQQNIMISQYLGMGKENLLQFPIRDSRTEQLSKAIDIISKMDDTTFTRFTELCIQKARQDNILQGIMEYQIIQALLLLKTKSETIMNSITNRNNQNSSREIQPKTAFQYCFTSQGILWCISYLIREALDTIIIFIWVLKLGLIWFIEDLFDEIIW